MARKKKGSPIQYKIPKAQKQINRDRQYVKFQAEPKLNEVTRDLHLHKPQCDTILGGKQIWLRGERSNGDQYKYPIIVDGTRCSATANRTARQNGKNIRRCPHHQLEDYWIKDAIPDDEYFASR